MTEEKLFPLEKILSCSAKDYVDSIGRNLRDYELRGVHYVTESTNEDTIRRFSSILPIDAEVVTDFRIFLRTVAISPYDAASHDKETGYASGTALVPRQT